jgi:hypothetical protein
MYFPVPSQDVTHQNLPGRDIPAGDGKTANLPFFTVYSVIIIFNNEGVYGIRLKIDYCWYILSSSVPGMIGTGAPYGGKMHFFLGIG